MSMKYFLLFLFACCYISCKPDKTSSTSTSSVKPTSNFTIVKKLPHDPKAFTQGLVHYNGSLIESTGLNGQSWISIYDPITLQYSKKLSLSSEFFGEGITILNDKIYQLTYKKRVGFIYDSKSFEKTSEFKYPISIKEGWGITHDNEHLIVSDGSSNLYFLDTLSHRIERQVNVSNNSNAKSKLNELEYFEGHIYANIWGSNMIIKIDPSDGEVIASYDLSLLEKMEKSKQPTIDVLNGITFDPVTRDMIVTGKYWPNYYYLRLKPNESGKKVN
ncbi:MAG: glutamine cyclotransferase [Saprospiraceae bacterium]|jgi:glutamine cyclotransferase